MGRVHAYDATDGRRPSRLAVLGVLSGRSAQGGQDRRVPSPWHPHYARDPLGRPGGALERPVLLSDFVQSLGDFVQSLLEADTSTGVQECTK